MIIKRVWVLVLMVLMAIEIFPLQAFASTQLNTVEGGYSSPMLHFPTYSVNPVIPFGKETVEGLFIAQEESGGNYTIYPLREGKQLLKVGELSTGEGAGRVPAWRWSDAGQANSVEGSIDFLYSLYLSKDSSFATDPIGSKVNVREWRIFTTEQAGLFTDKAVLSASMPISDYLKTLIPTLMVELRGEQVKLADIELEDIKAVDTLKNPDYTSELVRLEWIRQIVGSVAPAFKESEYKKVMDLKFEHLKKAEEVATEQAYKDLGAKPGPNASFWDKALWSAKYSFLRTKEGKKIGELPVTYAMTLQSDADFGTPNAELKRAYIQSLFKVWDFEPDPTWIRQTINNQISAFTPTDLATATYALRRYLQLDQDGELSTLNQKMFAYQYKLQATMGLASQLLVPVYGDQSGTAVTMEEVEAFISIAYGSSLSEIKGLLFPEIGYPASPHLGMRISKHYYYYLVLCYQEFAAYGTSIINILGPTVIDDGVTFAGRQDDVRALQSLFDTLCWADDTALWAYWNKANTKLIFDAKGYNSLKSVYDYLLSVDAFSNITAYKPESMDSAFAYFFGSPEGKFTLSNHMKEGIVASASYLPMRTNVYDPYTYSGITDTDWLLNFHAKFGYNRKALYIDTNVDAAVNYHRTGSRGKLRVCTLEDLMYADKDIVLYLDDNLYNVNKLAELQDKAFDRVDNIDKKSDTNDLKGKVWKTITGLWEVSMENIAKTAEVDVYSQSVMYGTVKAFTTKDEYFMSKEESKSYLSPDKVWDSKKQTVSQQEGSISSAYTPVTGFAVLSGIYNDDALFNSLNNALSKGTPVFISSPSMPYIKETNETERNQIFNYLLLKNLDSQMSVDYATNLDMTSPLYMDIYGNIVTESGLVVIPSAANATLWRAAYTPYNAALFSIYGDDFTLPYTEGDKQFNKTLKKVLTPVNGEWQLTSVRVDGGSIDLSKLSTADKESLAAISRVFEYDLNTGALYEQPKWQMLITEVLRGAPIEHIDKDFEGLGGSHRVTRNGLRVAEKLEFLVESLSSGGTNSTLAIPNPAYMEGIEYVVFFAFKLMILGTLVIWMFMIYVDAVGGGVNLRTGMKCIGATLLVISLVIGVPTAFELSYYQANKTLLQDETEYLMMLNLEKREAGQEIGITSVREPKGDTTLYLRLADIAIPWYDLLPKIIASSSTKNLEALYSDYEAQHPISGAEDVTILNNAAYISTDKLFDSSTITFSPTVRTLYQQASGDTPASYYTPYYYFLDQIIYQANQYAIDNNYYAYTTKVQRGGRLKTLGYVQPYFTSEEFMSADEGMDYFGLYTLYDVTPPRVYGRPELSEEALSALRNSQWCNVDMGVNARADRIEKINGFARKWVAEHRDMLGKVSDETFLKSMALACAMEHNRLFNTLKADSLEIYELANEDLMRLSIADHNTVMKSSTMSYARFVYNVGGTPAVYAAALLTLVNFVSSWVKPLVTLLVFVVTCVSIFWFKLVLRRDGSSIYGYVTTILLMCGVNVLGSLSLKASMFIPNTGLSPTVCIIVQILVQCAYMYLLTKVVKVAVKDWPNMGFQFHNKWFDKLTRHDHVSIDTRTPNQKSGWDYYHLLSDRQRRRRHL